MTPHAPAADGAPETAGAVRPPVVEAVRLSRAFGARRAVEDVTFALHGGECLALFGPNGAGKTTLLRMLAGLLRPTSGEARIGGVALPGGAAARARVGLISHQSMLYAALSARENVAFSARLHGVPGAPAAVERALATMRVADRADAPVRLLSRGLQQRVSIARAMVHSPDAVLLDEPFTGLDESGARALTGALESLAAAGAAVVLVTHNLAEGLSLATHAAVMRGGRIVSLERRDGLDAGRYVEEYRRMVGSQ